MSKLKKSCIFVCSKKSGCGACGSKKLIKNLKFELKDQDLKKQYKVVECSCLGLCKQGIATLTYPENRLITKLGKNDAGKLLKKIQKTPSKKVKTPPVIKRFLKIVGEA